MQNAEFSPERLARARAGDEAEARYKVLLERLATTVLPNQQRLQAAARAAGIEVVYTVIESLTRDGRDRSLDHKISRLHFPKGSWEAKVIADVAPVATRSSSPRRRPASSTRPTSSMCCATSASSSW
jgi:nicotinamidase-related amidase